MTLQNEIEVIQAVREIASLEKEAIKTLTDNDWSKLGDIVCEFVETKNRITKYIIGNASLYVPDERAKQILRKIRNNEPLVLDKVVAYFERQCGEPWMIASIITDVNGAEYEEFEQLTWEEFGSWIGPYEIIKGLHEAGMLILGRNIPKKLKPYIHEAKWCFAFQQHLAVAVLCRTILETAAKDICQSKGLFHSYNNVKDINEVNYLKIFRMASRPFLGDAREKPYNLYRDLSEFVHNRDPSPDRLKEIFQEVILMVEKLYAVNGLDL